MTDQFDLFDESGPVQTPAHNAALVAFHKAVLPPLPKLSDAQAIAAIRAAAWYRDTKAVGQIIAQSRLTYKQGWRAYVLALGE